MSQAVTWDDKARKHANAAERHQNVWTGRREEGGCDRERVGGEGGSVVDAVGVDKCAVGVAWYGMEDDSDEMECVSADGRAQ
ncbi:hypothetical protein FGB62_172g04 [Gracilaria domingensis]|nr:hypothetical protein FGB62_172g04 [Gracilaria domingensis]